MADGRPHPTASHLAEPRGGNSLSYFKGSLEVGSDFLIQGPQILFFFFGENSKDITIRNIKTSVDELEVRTDSLQKIS